jgi:hypothetical protein
MHCGGAQNLVRAGRAMLHGMPSQKQVATMVRYLGCSEQYEMHSLRAKDSSLVRCECSTQQTAKRV